MLTHGKKNTEIAAHIEKHKSVIGREIKRNQDQRSGAYNHELANRKYAKRLKEKPKLKRFTPQLQHYVERLLEEDYSPEQIVGVSKRDNIACVSHERIYQHIWADKKRKGVLPTFEEKGP